MKKNTTRIDKLNATLADRGTWLKVVKTERTDKRKESVYEITDAVTGAVMLTCVGWREVEVVCDSMQVAMNMAKTFVGHTLQYGSRSAYEQSKQQQ